MVAWLLLGLSLANADTVVLYTGDVAEAEARARKAARLKGELTLRRLVELAPGAAPFIPGEPPALRCAPGKLENVREGLENALALLDRSRDALAALDLARLDLECLGEPVDPLLAAQLYYLRGFLSWRMGNDANAESAFYRAFLFSPNTVWDASMGGPRPPRPFLAAEEHAHGYAESWLRVLPGLPEGFSLRVDGQPRELEDGRVPLKPGVHLLQVVVDGQTEQPLIFPLGDGEEKALVLPLALSESMLLRLDDPSVRDPLGRLITLAWPGDVVVATSPVSTWSYEAGVWTKR